MIKTKKFNQILLLLMLLFTISGKGQEHKIVLKDSLDGAYDMSDFLISAHGFLVIPTIVTEPALGGFGAAVAPVFLKKHEAVIDKNGKKRNIRPDITGGIGMYTANDSWLIGGFRSSTFIKPKILYRVMAAYGDLNLSFYENLANGKDKEFKLNFGTSIFYTQFLKQFNNHHWSAGPQYLFLNSKISLPSDSNAPNFLKEKDINSLVSQLGGAIQFDNRDNIFTPDKGVRIQSDFFWSDDAIGSDYDAWRINFSGIGYTPVTDKLIAGFRLEGAQAIGNPPFYLLPSINLRGVPVARYQGKTTLVAETEFRWDVYKRWSLMGFGGGGIAFNEWDNAFENPLVYSYGSGFRYLIARKFKLRMGIDVARGPEEWAYYLVFGSNWMR